MDEIINAQVRNRMGTVGIVTELDVEGRTISVDFGGEMKRFVFPDAFTGGFLRAVNEELQVAILADIQQAAEEERRRYDPEVIAEEARIAREEEIDTSLTIGGRRGNTRFDVKMTYADVDRQFGTNRADGVGRGINTPRGSNAVVLISVVDSDTHQFAYHDGWENDIFIYQGEGAVGDQTLTAGNRAITTAAADGKEIHLIIKLSPTEYYYQGVFEYIDHDIITAPDRNGNMRNKFRFRLRRVNP